MKLLLELIIEVLIILGFYILLFFYNAITTDMIIAFFSFSIYLILLIPIMFLLRLLADLVFFLHIENLLFVRAFF
ncbi:unnamed protein product, partial [marine sediment metagenome]